MAAGLPQSSSAPLAPAASASPRSRADSAWIWFLIYGISLMVVGLVAMSAVYISTLLVVWVLGILLLVGGGVQIATALTARGAGFWAHLIGGVIYAVIGVLMIEYPLHAIVGLTLLLAAGLLVGGLIRIVMALTERFPGWGMVLANGIISLILGGMLWRHWPEDSLWVIGMFAGIDMVLAGGVWVMFALGLRNAPRRV